MTAPGARARRPAAGMAAAGFLAAAVTGRSASRCSRSPSRSRRTANSPTACSSPAPGWWCTQAACRRSPNSTMLRSRRSWAACTSTRSPPAGRRLARTRRRCGRRAGPSGHGSAPPRREATAGVLTAMPDRLAFRHPLVRTVLDDDLPMSTRQGPCTCRPLRRCPPGPPRSGSPSTCSPPDQPPRPCRHGQPAWRVTSPPALRHWRRSCSARFWTWPRRAGRRLSCCAPPSPPRLPHWRRCPPQLRAAHRCGRLPDNRPGTPSQYVTGCWGRQTPPTTPGMASKPSAPLLATAWISPWRSPPGRSLWPSAHPSWPGQGSCYRWSAPWVPHPAST
jgi:hypothetical protein